MLTTDKTAGLALESRTLELQAVLRSIEVTDRDRLRLETEPAITALHELLAGLRQRHGCLYVIGNGGSAAIAAHAVTDFVKVGGIRALTLHDGSLMTCLANDYGYDNAFARALDTLCQPADVLIAISSSGQSANICNAVAAGHRRGAAIVTLSGFAPANPLRELGDFNAWLDSTDYGMVEVGHQFILHNLSDRLAPRP